MLSYPHLYTVACSSAPNFETAARAVELCGYKKNESQISWAHFPGIELLQRETSLLCFSRYVGGRAVVVELLDSGSEESARDQVELFVVET